MKLFFYFFFLMLLPINLPAVVLKTEFQESAPKYIREGRKISGICYDIISEINRRSVEKNITIVPTIPQNPFSNMTRIKYNLETGSREVFVGLARNAASEEKYNFVDTPIYSLSSSFAKLKSDNFDYTDEKSLKGKTIAFVQGTKTGRIIENLDGVATEGVSKLSLALRKLSSGQVDLVFYHSLGLLYTAKEMNILDQINLTKTSYETYSHYIAFNIDVPLEIVTSVEKTVSDMRRDGTLEKIINQYIK